MTRPLRPPEGGTAPPQDATFDDRVRVALRPLAEQICARYRAEFEDEAERYGDAGIAWCIHDNQHILNWAFLSIPDDEAILTKQVAWLASVLEARGFPLERLVRNLEIAADVVGEQVSGASAVAAALRASGASVLQ